MLLRRYEHRRPASVFMMFALFLFILFAVAALTIDLGFALLARREMQTGVDAAALEGVWGYDPSVPATDSQRRQAASDRIQVVFDDDLDPSNGDPLNFGAGPVPGVTPPVYKPTSFQLNLANDPAGDMVRGQYIDASSHVEPIDYQRADFNSTAQGGQAFLVRMRRSNEQFAAGNGASSAGPPVPFLFGQASLMAPDAKSRGITVRALAIADARPALSVGVANLRIGLQGTTPFALTQTFWNGLNLGTATLTTDGSAVLAGGNPVGQTIAPGVLSIGQLPTAGDLASYQATLPQGTFVPVLADSGTLQGRIIGFGSVTVAPDPNNPLQALITQQPSRIAVNNASTTVLNPLDAAAAGLADSLIQANQGMSQPLLAAALVR